MHNPYAVTYCIREPVTVFSRLPAHPKTLDPFPNDQARRPAPLPDGSKHPTPRVIRERLGRCFTRGIFMTRNTGAAVAIKAAKNVNRWGLFASLRYAMKHGATFAQFNIAHEFELRRATRRRLAGEFAGYLA